MEEQKKVKASQHESYWMLTLVTLVVPFAGFILGIVYLTKEKKVDRKLGEHLLAISILLTIVYGCLYFWFVANQVPAYTPAYTPTYQPPFGQ